MNEPVIDIRDRIEKMRNQMTSPDGQSSKAVKSSSENTPEKKIDDDSFKKEDKDQSELLEKYQKKSLDNLNENITEKKKEFSKSFEDTERITKISVQKENYKSKSTNSDFSNERFKSNEKISSKNSNSIKNDDVSFPQFSLNVSNPISWKLMLLIMVMQLLTNIMLVVVLYLK